MKKPYTIESRLRKNAPAWMRIITIREGWETFKSYATERARDSALANYERKYTFQEFRKAAK